MAEDLTLQQVIHRAYTRAVPATKALQLFENWARRKDLILTDEHAQNELAATLLAATTAPDPPALLASYLSHALSSSVLQPQVLLVHLLFLVFDRSPESLPDLSLVAQILLQSGAASTLQEPLPSSIRRPSYSPFIPDVGTSASAMHSTDTETTIPVLALLLPLIRPCATAGRSAVPAPILALTAQLLNLVPASPPQPLEIAVEAGGLMQTCPEVIATPLRNFLSSLMSDITLADTLAQVEAVSGGAGPTSDGMDVDVVTGDSLKYDAQAAESSDALVFHSGPIPLPVPQLLQFIFAYLRRSGRWTTRPPHDPGESPKPPEPHIQLIHLGPHLPSTPEAFLHHLLETAVTQLGGVIQGRSPDGFAKWLFLMEDVPILLRWWEEHSDPKWPYPTNLASTLGAVFDKLRSQLLAIDEWMTAAYIGFARQADAEHEAGQGMPRDWLLYSVEVTLCKRLIELDLLDKSQADPLLRDDCSIPSFVPGESLLDWVTDASQSQFNTLSHVIAFSPGAARYFSCEVISCIRACPITVPPDGLFLNLAAHPPFLVCAIAATSPASLLDALVKHLLERPTDQATRADDPQGSLTRFGDGVVLIEAVVKHFDLPVPDLLRDAHRAASYGSSDATRRSLINGWVKALFGSDGIDDEIVLATSPPEFYRLGAGIIQQGIFATAAGQIDLDTLHSGLSYFSQPLLSWTLGGIIGWLCKEIIRNGLLAALHLNVLQTLLFGGAFPSTLARVVRSDIEGILHPALGLEPVFQSSGFDVDAIRFKFEALGMPIDTALPSNTNPIMSLRSALSVVEQHDEATDGWEDVVLKAVELSIREEGDSSTIETMLEVTLHSRAANFYGATSDLLGPFVAILLSLRLSADSTSLLAMTFVDNLLPTLLDGQTSLARAVKSHSAKLSGALFASLLKRCLFIVADLELGRTRGSRPRTGELATHLMNELEYQQSRPIQEVCTGAKRGKGSMIRAGGQNPISAKMRDVLDMLIRALGSDEDIGAVWPGFEKAANDSA